MAVSMPQLFSQSVRLGRGRHGYPVALLISGVAIVFTQLFWAHLPVVFPVALLTGAVAGWLCGPRPALMCVLAYVAVVDFKLWGDPVHKLTEVALIVALALLIQQAEKKAARALATRDQFIAAAAHDLRAPLSVLSLKVQMMDRKCGSKCNPGALKSMRQTITRTTELLNRLLDVSQFDEEGVQLKREVMDLGPVARDTVDFLKEDYESHGCKLNLHMNNPPYVGFWDRVRLEQVLTNLLTNALRHCQGHDVDVYLGGNQHHIMLIVRDHGRGIDEDIFPKLFQRYAKGSTSKGGFGLGLWICHQIVHAHQGTIKAENAPGGGARFTVTLPRRQPTEAVPLYPIT